MTNALLLRRRGMMMAQQGGLPYDSKISYLESSTNCCIDLGFVPDDHTGIYVECTRTDSTDHYILGQRNDSDNTRYGIGKTSNAYCGWGAYVSGYSFSSGHLSLNWLRDHRFYVNSSHKTLTNPMPFSLVYNLVVFCFNNQGNLQTADAGIRISRFRVSRDSDVVMDLIPVRVGAIGYLYDEIGGQLYGNTMTGSFILGPDIP